MFDRASLTRILAHQVTSTATSSPTQPEDSYVRSGVHREPHDQVGAGKSSVSPTRPDVAGSISRYPWPSLPVQPLASSSDSLIRPNDHTPTHGCLTPDKAISRIEETATDWDRNGTDRLPGGAAQVFANAVHEVRLYTLSLPGRAV